MADSGAWYLKMNDGTIYGPADLNRLQAWARGGRVAPSGQISSDLKSWVPASQMPELGMEWLVEVEQGQYYGPFHPDVIRDLIAQKRIPASARRFRLDTGRAQDDHSKALNVALEKAKALIVERESALEKAKASLVEKDASLEKANVALTERESALEKAKASLAEKDAALEKAKALIVERESALEKAKASLAEKDAALEKANVALTERESALAKARTLLVEKDAALAKANAALTERESALAKARTLLVEKDAALAELKAALAEQKTLVAGLRGQEAGLAAKLEMSLDESRSAIAASALRIGELEAALKTEYAHAKELEAALTKSKSEAAASLVRAEKLGTALDAEHVRVENLLAQLVAAAEREKALRTDLDLARKTAASERKCVEAAIRKQRQTEKELEGARKDAEDLRVKVQKAKEQSKAAKGKGGLFQGASAADLAFLEQAARRELASARGRSASVSRPRPKALDVIDV